MSRKRDAAPTMHSRPRSGRAQATVTGGRYSHGAPRYTAGGLPQRSSGWFRPRRAGGPHVMARHSVSLPSNVSAGRASAQLRVQAAPRPREPRGSDAMAMALRSRPKAAKDLANPAVTVAVSPSTASSSRCPPRRGLGNAPAGTLAGVDPLGSVRRAERPGCTRSVIARGVAALRGQAAGRSM